MRALSLLACSLLLGSGCLTPLIARERADKVQRISRFDSGCDSMRLVQRMGNQRYLLRGCGQTYVYACHDRRPSGHWAPEAEAVDLLLTGGMDTDAPCHLERVRRAPPRPAPRRVAHQLEPVEPRSTGTSAADEPGVAGLATPARPALPRLPAPAEVKRVMTGIQPELRRCGLPSATRLQVRLKLAASGSVQRATVEGRALSGPTRRCVEQQIARARLSPFRAGPVTVAYLFDLR